MLSDDVRMTPTAGIKMEGGAQKMLKSPSVEPYLTNAEAAMTGKGWNKAAKAIAELPLERRYIYRIASSLQNAFCDFDRSSLRIDLSSMSAEDFDMVVGLIDRRPVQFAMLLRTCIFTVRTGGGR